MNEELRAELRRRVAPEPMRVSCPNCGATIEAWPPDESETRTANCPECGLVLTFRLGD